MQCVARGTRWQWRMLADIVGRLHFLTLAGIFWRGQGLRCDRFRVVRCLCLGVRLAVHARLCRLALVLPACLLLAGDMAATHAEASCDCTHALNGVVPTIQLRSEHANSCFPLHRLSWHEPHACQPFRAPSHCFSVAFSKRVVLKTERISHTHMRTTPARSAGA